MKAAREALGRAGDQMHLKGRIRWALISLTFVVSAAALGAAFHNHKPQLAQIKASETPKRDMLRWPADQPLHLSKEKAYHALFVRWNIPYQYNEVENVCKQLPSKDLHCLNARGSLDSLFNLNRPAVLKLFDEKGREFYAALISLHGQTAEFRVGSAAVSADIAEIGRRWLGDYTLLYRAPADLSQPIRAGQKGKAVQWLEGRLASAEGVPRRQGNIFVYDETLVDRVKKFQLSEGLVPDGIAGPQTIIHLNDRTEKGEPQLISKEEHL
jgi:general secretion pathway protein A